MLTANLSTLTPHSSLVFEEDNSTDSENGTSDEIDGEKKESSVEQKVDIKEEETQGASAQPGKSKINRQSTTLPFYQCSHLSFHTPVS